MLVGTRTQIYKNVDGGGQGFKKKEEYTNKSGFWKQRQGAVFCFMKTSKKVIFLYNFYYTNRNTDIQSG